MYAIVQAIAREFQGDPKNKALVAVNISGTSGGFEKFCAGETDISNASRPILKAKMEACKKMTIQQGNQLKLFAAFEMKLRNEL
ncbi:MAG: hypothetical protein V7K41_14005 [Nostoc sp.]|uniref:hypothetical protein n=1 Tax=Nostoc sp. TaxID=1180 RepID=UPI002FF9CA11